MTNQETAQMVADRIIELLDQGDLPPWEQPWKFSPLGDPRNAVSLKPYRGINRWLTLIAQGLGGYEDTRWLTYKQAQDLGGHVRKGEKSTSIVFWKRVARKGKDEEETPEELTKRDTYWLARLYRIFNAEQTEECRLEPLPGPPDPPPDPIEEAEAIIRAMPDPPGISTYGQTNQAPHYVPHQDQVRVPTRDRTRCRSGGTTRCSTS